MWLVRGGRVLCLVCAQFPHRALLQEWRAITLEYEGKLQQAGVVQKEVCTAMSTPR